MPASTLTCRIFGTAMNALHRMIPDGLAGTLTAFGMSPHAHPSIPLWFGKPQSSLETQWCNVYSVVWLPKCALGLQPLSPSRPSMPLRAERNTHAFTRMIHVRHVQVDAGTHTIGEQPGNIVICFFPRVRTPCGHGAQVIVEGREKQPDGGENNKNHKHNPKTKQKAQSRVTTIM